MMITPPKYYANLPQAVGRLFVEQADFLYSQVNFNMPDSPLHAKAHCERVLLHALATGAEESGADDMEGLEILAHAAVFHDTRREDEYLDTGHGARAAVYYEQFCRESDGKVKFHPEAAYLMRYHDLDDKVGIEAIRRDFGPEGKYRGHGTDKAPWVERLYAIFKDADALDRWRLGRWGLDVKYLRTPSARNRVNTAKALVTDTMDPQILAYYDKLIDDMMKGVES